jgi:hypothetical protein
VKPPTLVRTIPVVAAFVALFASGGSAQTAGQSVRLSGALINTNNGGTGHVDIDITRWSTVAETDRLLSVLEEQGQAGFLEALRKNRSVGSIHTPGHLGLDLKYASETRSPDGGSDILIGTDRWMSFAEIWRSGRSIDYPFTWIRIHLNSDGEGEGTITLASKVIPGGGHDIVVESYDWLQTILIKSLKERPVKS